MIICFYLSRIIFLNKLPFYISHSHLTFHKNLKLCSTRRCELKLVRKVHRIERVETENRCPSTGPTFTKGITGLVRPVWQQTGTRLYTALPYSWWCTLVEMKFSSDFSTTRLTLGRSVRDPGLPMLARWGRRNGALETPPGANYLSLVGWCMCRKIVCSSFGDDDLRLRSPFPRIVLRLRVSVSGCL